MNPASKIALLALLLTSACGTQDATVAEGAAPFPVPSYEEFRARYAFREPQTGVWIANGDTAFASEKRLREFYDEQARAAPGTTVEEQGLIVNRVANADDTWDAVTKRRLTYCVSDAFGARKAAVVQAMREATGEWMAAADVQYVYVPGSDAACSTASDLVFDVNPVNAGGAYIARAFFPSSPRSAREVLIDDSAFTPGAAYTLRGVLRHELGHTLGFRHEHTRPESGTCFENSDWRPLTPYDRASVMHYPQCNGTGSWALEITALDEEGAAALYGNALGGGTDGGSGGADGGTEVIEHFADTVAKATTKSYPPFEVQPGTQFRAALRGVGGDADLYVRFGSAPTATGYHCRPWLDDSNEDCLLTVPAGQGAAFVSVTGATRSTYSLDVTHTPPRTGVPLPGETCATAQPIAVDGSTIVTTVAGYAADGADCFGFQGPDRYFTFTLTQASNVNLGLSQGLNSNDFWSWTLSGPAAPATCGGAAAQSCGRLFWTLQPGTYYLAILGRAQNVDPLIMQLTAVPVAGSAGESCVGPAPLTFNGNRASASGTTVGMKHDRSGTCGGSLGDVVYSFTTTRAGALTASVATSTATFRPVVYLQQGTCTSSGNLKCSAAGVGATTAQLTSANLPAGTYFLWVDGVGSGGGTGGDFALDVTLQ